MSGDEEEFVSGNESPIIVAYAPLPRGEISAQDAILIALYRIRLCHTVVGLRNVKM